MKQKREFGELELAILKNIREGERVTVREMVDALGGKDKYTTIMTVMSRMVEKGLLCRAKNGNQYEYWIYYKVYTPKPSFLKKFKERVFRGRSLSMVSYLLESAEDVTREDLESLEKLIQHLKKDRK